MWARAFDSTANGYSRLLAVTFDAANDAVYVAGEFSDDVIPGGGLPTLTETGQVAVFIVRLSATTGDTLAAKGFSGTQSSTPNGVAVSEAGVYIAGFFTVRIHCCLSATSPHVRILSLWFEVAIPSSPPICQTYVHLRVP